MEALNAAFILFMVLCKIQTSTTLYTNTRPYAGNKEQPPRSSSSICNSTNGQPCPGGSESVSGCPEGKFLAEDGTCHCCSTRCPPGMYISTPCMFVKDMQCSYYPQNNASSEGIMNSTGLIMTLRNWVLLSVTTLYNSKQANTALYTNSRPDVDNKEQLSPSSSSICNSTNGQSCPGVSGCPEGKFSGENSTCHWCLTRCPPEMYIATPCSSDKDTQCSYYPECDGSSEGNTNSACSITTTWVLLSMEKAKELHFILKITLYFLLLCVVAILLSFGLMVRVTFFEYESPRYWNKIRMCIFKNKLPPKVLSFGIGDSLPYLDDCPEPVPVFGVTQFVRRPYQLHTYCSKDRVDPSEKWNMSTVASDDQHVEVTTGAEMNPLLGRAAVDSDHSSVSTLHPETFVRKFCPNPQHKVNLPLY